MSSKTLPFCLKSFSQDLFRGWDPFDPQPKIHWYSSGPVIYFHEECGTFVRRLPAPPGIEAEAGKTFVAKSFPKDYALRHAEELRQEIAVHKYLQHPCMPALRDVRVTYSRVHLVFDDAGKPLDFKAPASEAPTAEEIANNVGLATAAARTLLSLLTLLHRGGMRFGDMKPDQLVCRTEADGTLLVSLVDFGSIMHVGTITDDDTPVFTRLYGPPESHEPYFWDGYGVTASSTPHAFDVYGLGITVCEIALGCHPYMMETAGVPSEAALLKYRNQYAEEYLGYAPEVVYEMFERPLAFTAAPMWPHLPPHLQQLILASIQHDPAKRVQLEAIPHMPWAAPFGFEALPLLLPPELPIGSGELSITQDVPATGEEEQQEDERAVAGDCSKAAAQYPPAGDCAAALLRTQLAAETARAEVAEAARTALEAQLADARRRLHLETVASAARQQVAASTVLRVQASRDAAVARARELQSELDGLARARAAGVRDAEAIIAESRASAARGAAAWRAAAAATAGDRGTATGLSQEQLQVPSRAAMLASVARARELLSQMHRAPPAAVAEPVTGAASREQQVSDAAAVGAGQGMPWVFDEQRRRAAWMQRGPMGAPAAGATSFGGEREEAASQAVAEPVAAAPALPVAVNGSGSGLLAAAGGQASASLLGGSDEREVAPAEGEEGQEDGVVALLMAYNSSKGGLVGRSAEAPTAFEGRDTAAAKSSEEEEEEWDQAAGLAAFAVAINGGEGLFSSSGPSISSSGMSLPAGGVAASAAESDSDSEAAAVEEPQSVVQTSNDGSDSGGSGVGANSSRAEEVRQPVLAVSLESSTAEVSEPSSAEEALHLQPLQQEEEHEEQGQGHQQQQGQEQQNGEQDQDLEQPVVRAQLTLNLKQRIAGMLGFSKPGRKQRGQAAGVWHL